MRRNFDVTLTMKKRLSGTVCVNRELNDHERIVSVYKLLK